MITSNFIGRIGRGGAKVLEGRHGNFMTMDVATDIRINGETKPMWVRVRSNNPKHMGKLPQYLTQGKLIEVSGVQTEPSTWIGQDGQPRSQVVIIANTIEFVPTGRKNAEESQQAQQATNIPDPSKPNPAMPFPAQAPADDADGVPF